MSQNDLPQGWDEEKVKRVIDHYDSQSDDDAVAEDEAVYKDQTQSVMEVPIELVPEVRALIARKRKSA